MCGEALDRPTPAAFCRACLHEFAEFHPPYCPGCGATVPQPLAAGKTCGHCGGGKTRYDLAVSLGPYEGLLREQLLRAKKPTGEQVAVALAHRLLQHHSEQLQAADIDVVCPVPMHWRRRLRRMTNSPSTMASVIAQQLGVPLASGLLVRRRYTLPQFQLSPTDRLSNVRSAFRVAAGHRLQSAHVLLVDDILTTGATVTQCSRALRHGGAARVTVAAVARSYSDR